MSVTEYIEDRSIPEPNSGCWLWMLSLGSHGYGNACAPDSPVRVEVAHRVSYRAFVGPIPEGMLVQHKCDTKCCVNPDHLELGTDATNALDKQVKGRAARKLTARRVRWIKRFLAAGRYSQARIARAFGIHASTVGYIHRGRIWRHV